MFFFSKEQSGYAIDAGNFIRNDAVIDLRQKLENLKLLTFEELNQMYFKKLDKCEISEKGGAGLGLIKIFIDSKRQTTFYFEDIDQHFSFFKLKVHVSV